MRNINKDNSFESNGSGKYGSAARALKITAEVEVNTFRVAPRDGFSQHSIGVESYEIEVRFLRLKKKGHTH